MRQTYKTQRGFTLIELSIVLVIIGLIVGGILVGQNLIKAAQNRSFISQIERYNSAVATFRGKYDCLPGDCLNVRSLFTNTGGILPGGNGTLIYNGNGNGQLEFSFDVFNNGASNNEVAEVSQLFLHLQLAGMTSEGPLSNGGVGLVGTNNIFPPVPFDTGSGIMAFYWNDSNYWWAGVSANGACATTIAAGCMTDSTLTPAQAFAIDTKVDDGSPTTGNARAYWGVTHSDQLATPGFGQTPGAALCANTSSTYNVASSYATAPLCQMAIRWPL